MRRGRITAKSAGTPKGDPQLVDAQVLTVVSSVPPSNAFRPPYTIHATNLTHQPSYMTTADVDYSRVEVVDANGDRLDAGAISSLPSMPTFMGRVDGFWYEAAGGPGYLKRYGRPSVHMPSYGADVGDQWSGATFATLLDDPTVSLEDKKPLIDDLVQIGWDRYAMAEQDRYDPSLGGFSYTGHWDETAGQGCAAKMSILYFAWLTDFPLGTAAMLASNTTEGPDIVSSGQWFQLDNQCFYVDTSAASLGCGYGACQGCTPNGTPEWGIAHFLDIEQMRPTTQDQYQWGVAEVVPAGCSVVPNPVGCPEPNYIKYRISDSARAWWLQVLMSRIIADDLDSTGSKPTTWSSGYPFPKVVYDYMDRYYTTMTTEWCFTTQDTELFSKDFNGSLQADAWLTWGQGTAHFGRP